MFAVSNIAVSIEAVQMVALSYFTPEYHLNKLNISNILNIVTSVFYQFRFLTQFKINFVIKIVSVPNHYNMKTCVGVEV